MVQRGLGGRAQFPSLDISVYLNLKGLVNTAEIYLDPETVSISPSRVMTGLGRMSCGAGSIIDTPCAEQLSI